MSIKRNTKIVAIALIILVASSGGGYIWRSSVRDQIARSALAPEPDLRGVHPELVERIRAVRDEIQKGKHSTKALAALTRLYYANGWFEPAANMCIALQELEPNNPLWLYMLALVRANGGQLEEALPLMLRTIEIAPGHIPARLKAADAMAKLNQVDAAIAMQKFVLEKEPNNIYAQVGLGNIYAAKKRWDLALDHFQKAIASNSDFRPAWLGLVSVYEATGRQEAAAEGQSHVSQVAHSPESPDPWIDSMWEECYNVYYLRVAAHSNPDINVARQWLERAVRLQPDDSAAQKDLGMLLFQLKAFPEARRCLSAAAALAPNDSDAWLGLINFLRTTQDFAGMEEAIRNGLFHCPASPGLWLERGRMLARIRANDEALAAFAKSAQLEPNDASAHVESAVVCFQLQQTERALAELKIALTVQPNNPFAQVVMARYAIVVGDKATALLFMQKVTHNPAVFAEEKKQLLVAFEAGFGKLPR